LTPEGFEKLKKELKELLNHERPLVVQAVHAAAALGDRSENAEYIYGKRRLREIDRRIRFLQKRLDNVEVIASETLDESRVRFGCFVTIESEAGDQKSFQIVGQDELDPAQGRITFSSPLGRLLLGKGPGERFEWTRQGSTLEWTILSISREKF
jgi:transcription elongation factor GreB